MNSFAIGRHHCLTASGARFAFSRPEASEVRIKDIAVHLAKQCRFVGAVSTFYSVAQHCVLVSTILQSQGFPEAALYGLLHDAHEAYIGDVPRPARMAIKDAVGYDVLTLLAEDCDRIIFPALGLAWPMPEKIEMLVKHADDVALATERRDLMPDSDDDWGLPDPWKHVVKPMVWPKAEEQFLRRWSELCVLNRHEVPA